MTFSIERYMNVRQAYWPRFSADGQYVAFLANITDVPQVWQVPVIAEQGIVAWPDQLTFGPDRCLGIWASPRPDDNSMIYTRDVGGNENAQLVLLDPASGMERVLSEGYEGTMHLFGAWSPDGQRIMFAANRRNPANFDLYVQPLSGDPRMVWQHNEPGFLFNQAFSPDGRYAAVIRVSSGTRNDLFEIDLETGAARQLTPGSKDARFNAVRYSSDGRSLFVTTDHDADFLYMARLDLDTGSLERVVSVDWDIEIMELSPDGRHVAYVVNAGGTSELHLLDLQMKATQKVPAPDSTHGIVGYFDQQLAFSPDGQFLAFSYTSSTRTSDVYLWHLTGGTPYPITRSSHAGLPQDSFVAPQLIQYPSFDERQIPAWLYTPTTTSNEPSPAIIMVHGGPEAQFVPYFHSLVQYFTANGYAVLAPNVRGSTGYGKQFSHLDDVRLRMDSVADLAHASHWLGRQPQIDRQRIVVYGGSYGGFMVLSALTTYPELWAAGVDIVGISNFVTFLQNTSEYRRAHREAEYGSLTHDREFLEQIAPMNHLDQIRAPLMVIHGANDPRVPVSEAEQLVATLRTRDVPVEFMVFDDEGHGVVKLKNKLVAYPAIVAFLDKHLMVGTRPTE